MSLIRNTASKRARFLPTRTTPNLMAQKPRYQLLALNPKGSATPVSFSGPTASP